MDSRRYAIYGAMSCLVLGIYSLGLVMGLIGQYARSGAVYREAMTFLAAPAEPAPGEQPAQTEHPASAAAAAIDLKGLWETAPQAVAWLVQEDTVIRYPIVQGEDNEYYLHHLYNGERGKAGSLFLDCENSAGFQDRNSIVYGHNMRDGSMFASLLEYQNPGYFETHRTLQLITAEGAYEIEVFGAFAISPAEYRSAHSPWTMGWEDEAAYGEWLDAIQARSLFDSGVVLRTDDRVLTLSTCMTNRDDRFVVMGRFGG